MNLSSRMLARCVGLYLHDTPAFRGKRQLLMAVNGLARNLAVTSAYGVKVFMDVADRTNWYGLTGMYGHVVSDEIRKLGPGDCFVDVGANCGVFTLLAAKIVGPTGLVVAFEPSLTTFHRLIANLELNDVHNVLAFNLAIGARTANLEFEQTNLTHSGRNAVAANATLNGLRVAGISIADFPGLMSLIANRRVLVKIDVEGYELEVVQGLQALLERGQTSGIVVELDASNLARYGHRVEQIYDYLGRYGFRAAGAHNEEHFDQVFERSAVQTEQIAVGLHSRGIRHEVE